MIPFLKYFQIIEEDLQSSINQAKTILKNNGIENFEEVVSKLEQIYQTVQVKPEYRRYNSDANIPVLAFLYLANNDIQVLKMEYEDYLNIPVLTTKNMFQSEFNELKKKITDGKLFKPSPEKSALIRSFYVKIVEDIHANRKVEDSQPKMKSISTDENTVYEDDNIIVYRADSKNKCIKYGAGSSLCISVKGGGNYYWSYRMGNMRSDGLGMTTYFVFWNDGSNRILIDALGDEDGPANEYSWNPINPNTDKDITDIELIEKYPELKEPFSQKVFQFIPYSKKEEWFSIIEQQIDSINDSALKTLEDYEMFIESRDEENKDDYIKYNDWEKLSNKITYKNTAYLVKKYSGLGHIIDSQTMEKYLTPQDRERYINILIKSFDNGDYDDYFEKLPENIPHKIIEEYFLNYYERNYGEDRQSFEIEGYQSIGYFIINAITKTIDTDIDIWDIASRLKTYMDEYNIKYSDFFLGKFMTPDLVRNVFLNFSGQRRDLSEFLFVLIKFYKNNNIQVPKILYRCIANDPYLSARYLYKWYLYRLNNYPRNNIGKPNERLLRMVASKKSTTYYLLDSLKYYISSGDIKFDVNIPSYLIDVLLSGNDPQYNNLLSIIDLFYDK